MLIRSEIHVWSGFFITYFYYTQYAKTSNNYKMYYYIWMLYFYYNFIYFYRIQQIDCNFLQMALKRCRHFISEMYRFDIILWQPFIVFIMYLCLFQEDPALNTES